MSARSIALRQLKSDEGTVLHAYEDHLGYLTIGTGRLIDQRRGGGISQQESDYLLRNDIEAVYNDLASFRWFDRLDAVRQAALINMRFQLGYSGFRGFRLMIAALERGEYTLAAQHALSSQWAGQTPRRAERVARMIRTGQE